MLLTSHILAKPNTQNISQLHRNTSQYTSQLLHLLTNLLQPQHTNLLQLLLTNLPQPINPPQLLLQPINQLQLQPQPQLQLTSQLQLLKLQRSTINPLQHQRNPRSTTSQYLTTHQKYITRM